MSVAETFLIAMGIIFSVPFLIWRYGRTDYYAPLVVVQIITGILLGPGVLGAAYPDFHHFVFNKEVIQALNGIAWWGVMCFVWIAGIELDLKHPDQVGILLQLVERADALAGGLETAGRRDVGRRLS